MKVTEKALQRQGRRVFLCDFSPPRGSATAPGTEARGIDADFICVAYNPGRAVRTDSAAMAHAIRANAGKDVCFNLTPRDMNKLALQSHLLGAHALGLQNVVALAGDSLSQRDQQRMTAVNDFKTTELIEAIGRMNEGVDFRGSSLDAPTDFCTGAAIDLSKGICAEAELAQRKAQAGAQFFITQPVFSPEEVVRFRQACGEVGLHQPVFWGVQVLARHGVMFSPVPPSLTERLEEGESGAEIALEVLGALIEAGVNTFYLVPPVLRGGARDYEAANQALSVARSWE